MKILIHHPRLSYYIGGGETVPLEQAAQLSELGHNVEILTAKPPVYSQLYLQFKKRNPAIIIHEIELSAEEQRIYNEEPGKDWSRWDKEAIYFGQRSQSFYSNTNCTYDLVITHLLSDSLFIPRKFKNILHLHGVPSESRSIDDIFLDRPDHFIAVSKYVKDGWISLYPKLSKREISVCYNGLNTEKFPNLNTDRKIDLLFVGRLIKTKGIYEIISAIKILIDKKVQFNKLLIVGKGPEKESIEKEAAKLNISDKIELSSNLSDIELLNTYNTSKIFLCPSYAKEGVLTTMLEAASSGCALITANCCGMIEFAVDNKNGLLVEPNSAEDLAAKIKTLLTNDELRQELAARAAKDVRDNWDIETTIKKLEEIYNKSI